MIEIPESRTLADHAAEVLTGKVVMNITANKSPHKFAWFSGSPEEYHVRLSGKTITDTDAFGGMAEIAVGDMRLVFFDGTNVRYFAPGEELPQKHQLWLEFEDFSSLVCSVQMYGGILAASPEELEQNGYYRGSKSKLKPLDADFDADYFEELFKSSKQTLSAKAFLATEQRIPGLGNGVLQDILFNARIHPKKKLSAFSDGELEQLFNSVRSTLFEMTAQGGRDTERDLFGCKGGYKTILSAGTLDTPCAVCGATIAREAYLGGKVYFCPRCQVFEK